MQVLQRNLLITGLESVGLEAKRDAFLPTFFPRSELGAGAMNLRWKRRCLYLGSTHIQGISPETCYLSTTCKPQQLSIPNQCLFLGHTLLGSFPGSKSLSGSSRL